MTSQPDDHDPLTDTPQPDKTITERGRAFLKLHLAANVGPVTTARLLDHFDDPEDILLAPVRTLAGIHGVGPRTAQAIANARHSELDHIIDRARECRARIICLDDPEYPAPLRHIADPPTCIFLRGKLLPTDTVALAIVGTRRCSAYGREQATTFGRKLADIGFTIVSGMARGIDGWAHRGALNAGGRTVAVMGCGFNAVYPPEHEELAAQIAATGALVSEYPVDVAPRAANFPRRNRLIAGLALGVLVVEAGQRSGACITARLASDYGREVFAIPGRIDNPDQTAGTNSLIQKGYAKLVTAIEDIMQELDEVGDIMNPHFSQHTGRAHPNTSQTRETSAGAGGDDLPARPEGDAGRHGTTRLSQTESLVVSAVEREAASLGSDDGVDADQVARAAQLPIAKVCATLTALQLKGIVRTLPGQRYRLGHHSARNAD